MAREILRETIVILIETAVLLVLLAAVGLPGRRPPRAEAAVSFAETLQPRNVPSELMRTQRPR